MRCVLGLPIVVTFGASICFAQLQIDPACPVFMGKHTTELHVKYSPDSANGVLKHPKELILDVGVNAPGYQNSSRSIPLFRQDNGSWEGTLKPDVSDLWLYLILQVRDKTTGQVDNNSGRYWDVISCDKKGQPFYASIQRQAESYTGAQFTNGITRPENYDAAISVIEQQFKSPDYAVAELSPELWKFKVLRDGDSDSAWRKINKEVALYLENNRTRTSSLLAVANFVEFNPGRAASDLFPRMISYYKAINPAEAHNMERMHSMNAAEGEKSISQRVAALQEIIRQDSQDVAGKCAAVELLLLYQTVANVPAAEQVFSQMIRVNREWPDAYASMAAVYIENGQKAEEAVKLIATAESQLRAGEQAMPDDVNMTVTLGNQANDQTVLDYWRARVYLLQGKPELALPRARKVVESRGRKISDDYYYLAQALEGTGEKQKAIDAYLEAVTRPSRLHSEQVGKLRKLWVEGKFGNQQELEEKIQAKADEQFRQKNYVPALVKQPAPEYDLTTIGGERIKSGDLLDKTVVLNMWGVWCAPCIPELQGFARLQQKHPELTVLAVAISSEMPDLRKLIAQQEIESLRVAQSDALGSVLAKKGIPVTYVVDHGQIRVVHQGAMSDVVAYVESDLAALGAEKASVSSPVALTSR